MSRFPFLITALILIGIAVVSTRTVEETAKDIIQELANNSLEDWSPAFLATNSPIRGQVLPSTLFVPTSATDVEDKQRFAAYHIVPEKLDFADLLSKKDGTRLPTLLGGSFILISNSSAGFYLDGVQIREPNVYVDDVVAIHRIASPLNFLPHRRDHTGSSDWKMWIGIFSTFAISFSAAVYWIYRRNQSCINFSKSW